MKVSKKQKVINAARESFHRYGYAGTSVNAITEASGVSMTNFYYHFKSKQALAMIIIEDLSREMEQDIFRETILNKSLSPLGRLNSYYDKIVEKCILDEYMGCFLGNLALEQSGVSEDFRSVLSTLFQRWKGMIAECISDGIKAGCFSRNIDPESMASLIYSHVHGGLPPFENPQVRGSIPQQPGRDDETDNGAAVQAEQQAGLQRSRRVRVHFLISAQFPVLAAKRPFSPLRP